MPESFTQVPPNSTGNKLRTRSRVIGVDTVHEQAVFQGALPTYYALADNVAFAASKHHISVMNAAGSGVVVAVRKIYPINVQLGTVTGVAVRMDVKRATAHSAGTDITTVKADTDSPNLPAQVTVKTNGTVTESSLLYPLVLINEEISAAQTGLTSILAAATNWQPEGNEVQELRLREGEGLTIKQITSSTVGSHAWLVVFTVDDDA